MSCPEEQVSQETSVSVSPFYASSIPSGPQALCSSSQGGLSPFRPPSRSSPSEAFKSSRSYHGKRGQAVQRGCDSQEEARTALSATQEVPRQPKPRMAEGVGADKIINNWTQAQLGLFLLNKKSQVEWNDTAIPPKTFEKV